MILILDCVKTLKIYLLKSPLLQQQTMPGSNLQITMGLFTKEWITFRKPFRNVILTLSWFESLILPFVNAKLFQIRLLKCEKKGVFFYRDPPRKADFTLCERKALSERDSCVRILEMRVEAIHVHRQSAQ